MSTKKFFSPLRKNILYIFLIICVGAIVSGGVYLFNRSVVSEYPQELNERQALKRTLLSV